MTGVIQGLMPGPCRDALANFAVKSNEAGTNPLREGARRGAVAVLGSWMKAAFLAARRTLTKPAWSGMSRMTGCSADGGDGHH